MRLGLGTAQLGLPYGATNRAGKPDRIEVRALLQAAKLGGFSVIDTAATYGDSEEALGACLPEDWQPFIVTKTPPMSGLDPGKTAQLISNSLEHSRDNLGRPVNGLLVHHAQDLIGPFGKSLRYALLDAKETGQVTCVGVSVYNESEIDAVLKYFHPDIVQLPASFADQRLIRSGHVAKLAEMGTEVHCRSALLQGVLLWDRAFRHDFFKELDPLFDFLNRICEETGKSRLELCLAFLLQSEGIDSIILGAANAIEVSGLTAAFRGGLSCPPLSWHEIPVLGENILNPSSWPTRSKLLRS